MTDIYAARSTGKPRWLRHVVSRKRFSSWGPSSGISAFAIFSDPEPADEYAKRLNTAVSYASELMFGTRDKAVVCPKALNPYEVGALDPTLDRLSKKGYRYYVRGLWDRDPVDYDELVSEWEADVPTWDPVKAGYVPEDPKDRWDEEA